MTTTDVDLLGAMEPGFDEVLTNDALVFVAELQRRFGPTREDLLRARAERRQRLAHGGALDFLEETRDVRESDWQVAPAPSDLQQRWVEITGPTERKMAINALNSGAHGFMADLEDANSPTWQNMAPTAAITSSVPNRPRCLCVHAAGTCPKVTCSLRTSRWPARCSTSGCTSFAARRGW